MNEERAAKRRRKTSKIAKNAASNMHMLIAGSDAEAAADAGIFF